MVLPGIQAPFGFQPIAMGALAAGIATEAYVVVQLVTHHAGASLATALTCATLFAAAWFVFPLHGRAADKQRGR